DAARRAPDVRHAVHAEEGLHRIDHSQGGIESGFTHWAASRMAFTMTSGLCTVPPACDTAMTLARPAAWRSTSWTIWPRLSSGTTKALTRPASSRMCCSGKGQAEMRRNMPALMPWARAIWVARWAMREVMPRSEEHTSELQSLTNLVCRLLLEKK